MCVRLAFIRQLCLGMPPRFVGHRSLSQIFVMMFNKAFLSCFHSQLVESWSFLSMSLSPSSRLFPVLLLSALLTYSHLLSWIQWLLGGSQHGILVFFPRSLGQLLILFQLLINLLIVVLVTGAHHVLNRNQLTVLLLLSYLVSVLLFPFSSEIQCLSKSSPYCDRNVL